VVLTAVELLTTRNTIKFLRGCTDFAYSPAARACRGAKGSGSSTASPIKARQQRLGKSSYGLDKEQGRAYCPSRELKSGMTVAELLDDNLMMGEGIFGEAETLVELIECLQETRVELWHLARDVEKGDAS